MASTFKNGLIGKSMFITWRLRRSDLSHSPKYVGLDPVTSVPHTFQNADRGGVKSRKVYKTEV